MLTVDHAIRRLLDAARLLTPAESVPLTEAWGRVIAADVEATSDVPPADNSAMDGYALCRQDWPGAKSPVRISQRITAGSIGNPLARGTAARIFTGAPVPQGADTVVMQENTRPTDTDSVVILELPEKGANIRPRGQDIVSGERILQRGIRLRPQDTGLLASQGHSAVDCFRKLRVALLSTGDELLVPGEPASPGKIFNSNRFTIAGLIQAWGFEFIDLGIVGDDPDAIRDALRAGSDEADVIVTSGGVSVGEEDHVRAVVESLGSIDLWKILVKPGKPFAFGRIGETPFLGLPGNPVSVFVTLAVIARPFLMACQGESWSGPALVSKRADFDMAASQREVYLRVRETEQGLGLFPVERSGVLKSLCWADGLVRQEVGQSIRRGDEVSYLPFSGLT